MREAGHDRKASGPCLRVRGRFRSVLAGVASVRDPNGLANSFLTDPLWVRPSGHQDFFLFQAPSVPFGAGIPMRALPGSIQAVSEITHSDP